MLSFKLVKAQDSLFIDSRYLPIVHKAYKTIPIKKTRNYSINFKYNSI